MRKKGGIPLLYISHNAINLEPPSDASQQSATDTVTNKISKSHDSLVALKKSVLGEVEEKQKKKRKGPKGPNPLSCKKKAKKDGSTSEVGKKRTRKRRRRIHIPEHVKAHLQAQTSKHS